MKIVVEGDRRLLERYDVILLNPQTHPQAKQAPAHSLADWLASPEGQTPIASYTKGGQKLFHPETDPLGLACTSIKPAATSLRRGLDVKRFL